MNRHDADSSIDHHTAAIKWRPDVPVGHASTGDRDQHYVMFRGNWRHVPRIIQRAWEYVIPRLFGSCATSTIKANGYWTGSIR